MLQTSPMDLMRKRMERYATSLGKAGKK
jgi:hypothetical protein